jgi:cation:H+ antiporter
LAITAIYRPLAVQKSIITREIPMLLLAVAALVVMSEDVRLNGAANDSLSRADGVLLLLIFCVFVYSMVSQAFDKRSSDAFVADVVQEERAVVDRPLWIDAGWTIAGLIGVAAGGRIAVVGATGIAQAAGISEVVIGLTIVSFGTTLPELATTIIAARKGQGDLAIGNVIGSNIYNLLFIGGLVSVINPIPIPPGGETDLLLMAGLCFALLPITLRQRRVTRGEGVLLAIVYLGYTAFRLAGSR